MTFAPFQMAFPEKETRPSLAHQPQRILDASDIRQDTFSATPDWVNRSSKFTAGEKGCFGVIYAEIRKSGGTSCLIRQDALAQKLGITERTVRRQVAQLRESGVLGVYDNRSRCRPNEYFILHNNLRSKPDLRAENTCPEATEQSRTSGHPRPLVTPDLRTSASSSSEEENTDQKIRTISFRDSWEGSFHSPSGPQAKKETADGAQGAGKSSAADAPHQPTSKEIGGMGFDDPTEPDVRKEKARAAAQAAASKHHQDVVKRDRKRSERVQSKADSGKLFPAIDALEGKWRDVVGDRLPDVIPPKWGKRDRQLAGDLIKRSSYEIADSAIEFAVSNWDQLFPKLVGPKREIEMPTFSFFHFHYDKISPISQMWARHKNVWKRLDKWRATADGYSPMPDDLQSDLELANADMAKVGFKL